MAIIVLDKHMEHTDIENFPADVFVLVHHFDSIAHFVWENEKNQKTGGNIAKD